MRFVPEFLPDPGGLPAPRNADIRVAAVQAGADLLAALASYMKVQGGDTETINAAKEAAREAFAIAVAHEDDIT